MFPSLPKNTSVNQEEFALEKEQLGVSPLSSRQKETKSLVSAEALFLTGNATFAQDAMNDSEICHN